MKHFLALLAASTAISGIGISAALADPDFTAAISAGPGQVSLNSMGSDVTLDGYGVVGLLSGAYNFTPVLGVQGDLLIRFSNVEEGGDELTTTSLDGALHGFYREPEKLLLGGIVQIGQDTPEFNGIEGANATRSLVGAEGQAFFDQFTAYGQLGLQKLAIDGSDDDLDGWFITGEVRYFLTPDFKLELHAGRSELNADLGSLNVQIETLNVGVGAEYKLADLPFSIFGKYDYSTTTVSLTDDGSFDTHRVLVGLKFNLGDDSLQDRDRNGASLKPVDFGSNTNLFTSLGSPPP